MSLPERIRLPETRFFYSSWLSTASCTYYAYGSLRAGVPTLLSTDRTFTGQKADGTGLHALATPTH